MGVGKTLICLALILLTRHQLAQVSPLETGLSPIVTPHMLHTYPFGPAQDLRSQIPPLELHLALPTLVEICANTLASRDQSPAIKFNKKIPGLLKQRVCYYKFSNNANHMRTARGVGEGPQRIYLAKTTLVIVPPILVNQWLEEIEKHVERGELLVLKVEGDLPSVHEMLRHDVSKMMVTTSEGMLMADCSHGCLTYVLNIVASSWQDLAEKRPPTLQTRARVLQNFLT